MAATHLEKHSFKSELQQVLHLITHSLYSHKEIFLRELISNASDAIDKVRFNSLQNEHLVEGDRDWKIKLSADAAAGTLTISDNGIGMTRDEIISRTWAPSPSPAPARSWTASSRRTLPPGWN